MADEGDSDQGVVLDGEPTLDELMRWVLQQPAPAPTVSGLIDLAAVGTVLHGWRNSPVEDVHATAGSPLTDGEMMRTNAATTRLVRESLAVFFFSTLDQPVALTPQLTTTDDEGGERTRYRTGSYSTSSTM